MRWAAAALAVAACAGLSGCMSVSDEGAKPTPGTSGVKRGASAGPVGEGTAGGDTGSWEGPTGQTGPEVTGADSASPVPSGSPTDTEYPSVIVGVPVERPGVTPKPKPTVGHENPGAGTGGPVGSVTGGGSGGGTGTGGGSGGGGTTPPPEPTAPTAEPTPEPTVPSPEPTPEPTSNPTEPPQTGAGTQMGALRVIEEFGEPLEPMASPQVGPV
ncbi:hypothetical protein BU197_12540 [Streptomyces sp. CBMA291]|nr:hypothetical protein [Streptomyces sp. CBMA291]MBD0714460.1 hypothetical protein [Streptomyces sp. CBMA370]